MNSRPCPDVSDGQPDRETNPVTGGTTWHNEEWFNDINGNSHPWPISGDESPSGCLGLILGGMSGVLSRFGTDFRGFGSCLRIIKTLIHYPKLRQEQNCLYYSG